MVATARQHPGVFEALRQAVFLSAANVLDGSVLQDERLDIPTEENCVLREFGLVDRPAFVAWFEEYSEFLGCFDDCHDWRQANGTRDDKESIRLFYEHYLNGVYHVLSAFLDKEQDLADGEVDRKIKTGIRRILDAEQRLRRRLNFAIPDNFMHFWKTKLQPDLLKRAVESLAQRIWQSAPKPATYPPPDGLLRAATLRQEIAKTLVGCSGTDSVVKLLEAHVAACGEGDDHGRAPSGYLRLAHAKQLLGVLRSGHWMPSK
eukprot:5159963-Prymnesium_polylepis.1